MELDHIIVRGAREHNLKNLTLRIPKKRLVVFTGVSGSGKSSLAFDTLYAEGQRRYVESLSSYARQFLELMEKPAYDSIRGLSPSIAIDQKKASRNPRSTVGTTTEIHDYLRVLYARCGIQHCPDCDLPVTGGTAERITEEVAGLDPGTRFEVLAPLARQRKGTHQEALDELRKAGFLRVRVDGTLRRLDEGDFGLDKKRKHDLDLVVDRLKIPPEAAADGFSARLLEAVETGLEQGDGLLHIRTEAGETTTWSEHRICTRCSRGFAELVPQHFSFNSPLGSCSRCSGLGTVKEVDPELVIPLPSLSLNQGAILPWQKKQKDRGSWLDETLEGLEAHHGIAPDQPWEALTKAAQKRVLHGAGAERRWRGQAPGLSGRSFEGVLPWLRRRLRRLHRSLRRFQVLEFFSDQACPQCDGGRLRPESQAVYVGDRSLVEVSHLPIHQAHRFFRELELEGEAAVIAREVLKEVRNRLRFLEDVGLGYLTLDRLARSLSGGEAQRIRLASQVGSDLCGVIYILDEPSIGLHQRDNRRLLETLCRLRDIGNTVIVVEHDEETMLTADHLVDFGPGAGILGGEIVAEGQPEVIRTHPLSLTGEYLSGRREIPIPVERRPLPGDGEEDAWLTVTGARQNNLQDLTVRFPKGRFTCVTGVSGAGKSTLVKEILEPVLARRLNRSTDRPGSHDDVTGLAGLDKVIPISQDPIGRTPRSNPATYTKVFDRIRALFADLRESRIRGYQRGRFSFNVKGGRCEACSGDGVKCIEMHFLPDVYVPCEACKGRRFNEATLRVKYKGKHIADVLDQTVHEALELFADRPKIHRILQTLADVGMDYVKLGQPSPSLSGGEAQRIKLARELSRRAKDPAVYILDEPTTGLHFHDIAKLLAVLQRLAEKGHTVIVIEHNLDVIKCADYLVDLGPEGGAAGGHLVASGTPEEVAGVEASYTGRFLREKLHMEQVVV